MVAICTLAELFLLLITTLKQEDDIENKEGAVEDKQESKRITEEKSLVLLKKISLILNQLAHQYKYFSDSAVYNMFASSCKFFDSQLFNPPKSLSTDWDIHLERIIRAVCSLLSKELEMFLLDKSNERSKRVLPSLLCLGIMLGQVVSGHSAQLWRDLVSGYHIASQLIEAAAAALQMKQQTDYSLLMLEFLSVLSLDDEWSFRQVDILELHSAWDSLKPPIQKLFGPVPVCLEERSLFEVTSWYPVYMRALQLVTALVSHPCPNTRELAFDFIYQHEKFICDIFEFKDDSLKENALELTSSALRLLWHAIQALVPWNWKLKTILGRILVKVKLYVSSLVDLIGDPDSLLKRNALAHHHKIFPPSELKTKDMHIELQHLQNRLLKMLAECMTVLKETCPLHSDLLMADRLGLPMNKMKLLIEPRPPAETGPEYHTLINLINMLSKRLASNHRVSPRSSSTHMVVTPSKPSDDSNKIKTTAEHFKSSSREVIGKDDTYFSVKLSACSPKDLKLVLELTVHYTISNTLLTILSDEMDFNQSVVFLRDLSTEAKTFLEYAQRLNYGKEDNLHWKPQSIELAGYKPLNWNSTDDNVMEDSVSLGCALLSDAESDNDSWTSQRSTSPDSRSERHSKRLKVNQTSRLPPNLQHFLPSDIQFDPSFEPNSRNRKYPKYKEISNEEDLSTDFILFCNHMLKQMFGVHGFDERSLRGGL